MLDGRQRPGLRAVAGRVGGGEPGAAVAGRARERAAQRGEAGRQRLGVLRPRRRGGRRGRAHRGRRGRPAAAREDHVVVAAAGRDGAEAQLVADPVEPRQPVGVLEFVELAGEQRVGQRLLLLALGLGEDQRGGRGGERVAAREADAVERGAQVALGRQQRRRRAAGPGDADRGAVHERAVRRRDRRVGVDRPAELGQLVPDGLAGLRRERIELGVRVPAGDEVGERAADAGVLRLVERVVEGEPALNVVGVEGPAGERLRLAQAADGQRRRGSALRDRLQVPATLPRCRRVVDVRLQPRSDVARPRAGVLAIAEPHDQPAAWQRRQFAGAGVEQRERVRQRPVQVHAGLARL